MISLSSCMRNVTIHITHANRHTDLPELTHKVRGKEYNLK